MSDNFFVYTDISCLPLTEHATYLEEGVGGLCTGGTAIIELFSMRRQISKNDLVTILPCQLASIHKVSDDFSMTSQKAFSPACRWVLKFMTRKVFYAI